MGVSGRDALVKVGANLTAFGEDGEDGVGEDGAMFELLLAEGLTSTVTYCFPREADMVVSGASGR